jgi:hypothetical protein
MSGKDDPYEKQDRLIAEYKASGRKSEIQDVRNCIVISRLSIQRYQRIYAIWRESIVRIIYAT